MRILAVLIAAGAFACSAGSRLADAIRASPHAPPSFCGNERWDVKTLSDEDAFAAFGRIAQPTTIEELLKILPPQWSSHLPRLERETMQVVVEGCLLDARNEVDHDVHITVGELFRSVVAEFPDPECVSNLAARELVARAREQLVAILNAPRAWTTEGCPLPVRVRAVLFFDKWHGQSGGAWNGAELHPVLDIELRR